MTKNETPAEVTSGSVSSAIGSIVTDPKNRMRIYAGAILAGAGVWTVSETADAVNVALAAGLSPLEVALAGAKAALSYMLPLLGGLAIANTKTNA